MRKLSLLLCFLVVLQIAWGADAYVYTGSATILYARGKVLVISGNRRRQAEISQQVKAGDSIVTGRDGFCIVQLPSGERISVDPEANLTLWVMFHSPGPGSWTASYHAISRKMEAPFIFIREVRRNGVDFEDESPNTLASSEG